MIDTKQMAKYIFEEYANCYSEVDIEELAKHLDEIKSEAIKEFAKRLIAVSHPYADTQMVFEIQIDNLVKEMVGDD